MFGALLSHLAALGAGTCDGTTRTFFGLKPWYFYAKFDANCSYLPANGNGFTASDIWPILAVLFEDLIVVATYVAVGFVLYGGFQMITSQGEPEKFKNARGTVVSALIGLVISILGGRIIGYVFRGIF